MYCRWTTQIGEIIDTKLGEHQVASRGENEVVLLIRAEALRMYPNMIMYLIHEDLLKKNSVDLDNEAERGKYVMYPIFEASLPPDIVCLGFPMNEERVKENYFIVFEERSSEDRFGLDLTGPAAPDVNNMSWQYFGVSDGEYIDNNRPEHRAAFLAHVMRQRQSTHGRENEGSFTVGMYIPVPTHLYV